MFLRFSIIRRNCIKFSEYTGFISTVLYHYYLLKFSKVVSVSATFALSFQIS